MDDLFDPEKAILVVTNQQLRELTDNELNQLNVAIGLGQDPKNKAGYDKVSTLFTIDNGTKVHSLVAQAFAIEVLRRFGGPKT